MRNAIVSYLNNSTYFYFLVFNRLVNKNYNHLILLFKIIKNAFFGKDNSLFGKVLPNICKNSFLNSPNFFPAKLSFLKVYKMFLGKRCREVFRTQLMKQLMKLSEIVNVFQSLNAFAQSSILDVRLGSENPSGIFKFSCTKRFAIMLMEKLSNRLTTKMFCVHEKCN